MLQEVDTHLFLDIGWDFEDMSTRSVGAFYCPGPRPPIDPTISPEPREISLSRADICDLRHSVEVVVASKILAVGPIRGWNMTGSENSGTT